MLPTAVRTTIASISRLLRSVGLASVAAAVCVTMPLAASAQGQPPADGCGGRWIYGPGQDSRALVPDQLSGSSSTMRAVEWDTDGRSGPEKPWLVIMTNGMRPFAWDGERWLELPQVPGGLAESTSDVVLVVYRDQLYTTGRTAAAGVLKLQDGAWTTAFTTGRLVTALAVDGDRLLVADATESQNVSIRGEQRLGAWDGTTYTTLATGLLQGNAGGFNRTLAIARWNGDLYVAGRYSIRVTPPGGSPTTVTFDLARVVPGAGDAPGTFQSLPLAPEAGSSSIGILRLVTTPGELRAVYPGGTLGRTVAAWNGTAWRDDGIGEPFLVDGVLYRQTRFGSSNVLQGRLQRLDGNQWVDIDSLVTPLRPVVGVSGRDLVLQSSSDGAIVLWLSVDDAEARLRDRDLAGTGITNVLGFGQRVVVDGDRAVFGGLGGDMSFGSGPQGTANPQLATFDGFEWRAIGPAMSVSIGGTRAASVNDLLLDGSLLYATTGNRFAGSTEINGIGVWNGQAWQPLGTGLSLVGFGTFAANRAVRFQGDLIVSGRFDRAGGQVVSNVARWDGTQWWPMGELQSDAKFAVLNGKLYALTGALFRWDGLAWTRLGRSFSFRTHDLKVWRGELYAAGAFSQVGGELSVYIAVFRGGDWQALPVPLPQIGPPAPPGQSLQGLLSIKPTADGLIAHGRFALPGETEARPRIAKWTGTSWEPVASGLPADDGSITMSAELGNERVVTGPISRINGQISRMYARWSPDGRPWIAQPPRSATSSIGGSVDFKAEAATGYTGLVFKWLRNGEELTDGTTASGSSVLGANTRWLTVSNLQAADAGSYVLRISNPCGQSLSAAASLTLRCSASDVAGANQSVGSDGSLTADDIIVFLGWFFASDSRADIAGPNQSTTPDASFTADDIIVFLGRFFAGC